MESGSNIVLWSSKQPKVSVVAATPRAPPENSDNEPDRNGDLSPTTAPTSGANEQRTPYQLPMTSNAAERSNFSVESFFATEINTSTSYRPQVSSNSYSSSAAPPIDFIAKQSYDDTIGPSPLTSQTSSTREIPKEPMESVRRVEFQQTEGGVFISVPVETTATMGGIKNLNEETHRLGYDSDGELGPFFDAVANENWYSDSDDDEEPVFLMTPPTPPEQSAPPAIASTVDANQPIAAAVSLTEVEVRAMNVNQLKEQLKKRSKSTNGKKSVLTERLLACLNAPVVSQEEARKGEKLAKDLQAFHPNAAWRELVPNADAVLEPQRPAHLRGPTVPENEQEPPKLDFDAEWERPPFIAMSSVLKLGARGNPIKNKNGKAEQYENEVREKGRANLEWLKKENLTPDSKPHQWFEALLPVNRRPHDPPSALEERSKNNHVPIRLSVPDRPCMVWPAAAK
jgi:hypothetical protein